MSARRKVLDTVTIKAGTHAGLWLDKFLKEQTSDDSTEDQKGAKSSLLDEVAGRVAPDGYKRAFALREPAAPATGRVTWIGEATVVGRCVVGLGQKGPTEIGIALEHTWGVPVLPGSALKGVTASAAHLLFGGSDWEKPLREGQKALSREANSFDWLFGTTEERGAVVFHDAWWVPDSAKQPLALDVMTVHHQAYYGGEGDAPPSDMDSPNPVSFLTAVGKFRVVLEGEEAWVEAAWSLLEAGLRELGIGAKTNAGYGRMRLERVKSNEERAREAQQQEASKLASELTGPGNATQVFEKFARLVTAGASPEALALTARSLIEGGERRKWWKEWIKKDKRKPEEKALFEQYFRPHMA